MVANYVATTRAKDIQSVVSSVVSHNMTVELSNLISTMNAVI